MTNKLRLADVFSPARSIRDKMTTLYCSIELNKEQGVTVKVADDQGKIVQTIKLDGTKLELQVASKEATSTVVQKDASIVTTIKKGPDTSTVHQDPTDVRVTCKKFSVDAEDVSIKTTKDTSVAADGKVSVSAKKDLGLSTSAAGTFKASRDLSLKAGSALKNSGGRQFSASAPQVSIKAKAKATMDGGAQLALSAAKLSAKGKAQLEASAPLTNLGKMMTTVKGQIVKVQGTLVKLG